MGIFFGCFVFSLENCRGISRYPSRLCLLAWTMVECTTETTTGSATTAMNSRTFPCIDSRSGSHWNEWVNVFSLSLSLLCLIITIVIIMMIVCGRILEWFKNKTFAMAKNRTSRTVVCTLSCSAHTCCCCTGNRQAMQKGKESLTIPLESGIRVVGRESRFKESLWSLSSRWKNLDLKFISLQEIECKNSDSCDCFRKNSFFKKRFAFRKRDFKTKESKYLKSRNRMACFKRFLRIFEDYFAREKTLEFDPWRFLNRIRLLPVSVNE